MQPPYPPLRARARGRILRRMERATQRPEGFEKPASWTNEPPPQPAPIAVEEDLSPTRYGDWTLKGVAVDF